MVQVFLIGLVVGSAPLAAADGAAAERGPRFYENPLSITLPDGSLQTNCADPTILQSQTPGDPGWYAFCTTDSLSDGDVDARGVRRLHHIPILRSTDLVSWQNIGDAFGDTLPSWMAPGAGLWAPEAVYAGGLYYLYYTVTDVADAVSGEPGCGGDSAIGVATSASLAGPWVDHGAPVVAPRRNGPGCNFFWTYDPDVVSDGAGQSYIYYGSYYGGIEARPLSVDGLSTDPTAAVPIAIPNRYEGTEVVKRGGYYYLFASAGNCCNGPLTGYQVFAGRATGPLGPFVDAQGVSFLDARVGGEPALTLNGNRWVGTGHNTVFQDANGDWYTAYHAVDQGDPYFAGAVGYTKRHLLVDGLTWADGWPKVRHGLGASDTPQVAPAARRSGRGPSGEYRELYEALVELGDPRAFLLVLDALDVHRLRPDSDLSDEFDGTTLGPHWAWVRPPASGIQVTGGSFEFPTEAADLFGASNNASVLVEATPPGDYLVETKVSLDVPAAGCCQNFVQAGIAIYGGDDDYVRLTHVSIWETRQTEFAKEIPNPAPGYPFFGSSLGAPPDATTWLRIAKVTRAGLDHYVSYVSRDGRAWRRGGVWTDAIGAARIGLLSMGGSGFTASFDYVRVYRLP